MSQHIHAWVLSVVLTTFLPSLGLAKSEIGKIVKTNGKVWIQSKGAEKRLEAQKNTLLNIDDILVTENDGEAHVLLGGQEAALLIKKNSTLQLSKPSPQDWRLDLKQGMLVSKVHHKKNTKRRFQIKTPTAVIGVRGTLFFMKQEPDKDLFLCTCNGMVAVDNQAIILGKNHDSPRWIQAGKGPISQRLKPAEVGSDHSSADAEVLSQLIHD